MPVEISVPFHIADDGSVAFESSPDRQIAQRVNALVSTEPGERVMQPGYGVALQALVFETDDELVTAETTDIVAKALSFYEPGLILRSVNPVRGKHGDGISTVEVQYSRSDAASTDASLARNVNTAEVRIGGEVREVIRG